MGALLIMNSEALRLVGRDVGTDVNQGVNKTAATGMFNLRSRPVSADLGTLERGVAPIPTLMSRCLVVKYGVPV